METPAESSAPPPAAGRPPRPGQRPARATPAPGVMGAIRGAARTGLVGVARPRWAARRAERLPWWAAWAIYWVAWWALLAGLGTVEALQFAPPDAGPIELVLLAVYELNLERWTPSYPSGWEVLLAQLVVIQLAPVTLGWLLLGWDGREESRAASVWRSTRRLWGVMPHIAAVVVAATVLWGLLDAAVARAVDRLYSAEPVDQSAYGPIYADLPWWARYDESLFAVMVLVASVWSVTALLWAVAAGGWGGRCRWPAVCEGCGYNLAGLRAEGTCPECGRARLESIAPDVRPGLRWVSVAGCGLASVVGYVTLAADAVLRPTALGRAMRVFEPAAHHRWFLAGSFAVLAVVQAFGVGALMLSEDLSNGDAIVFAWAATTIAGGIVLLGWTFAASVLVGSLVDRGQRGGSAAACRGACYLSGLLVIYAALLWWVFWAIILTEGEPIESIGSLLQLDPEGVLLLLLAGMGLAGVGLHLLLLIRVVRAARHANR